MTLKEYQERAMVTCMPSCENFSYMMLNLVGEVGELASKVAKAIRKGTVEITSEYQSSSYLMPYMTEEEWLRFNQELMLEAGDILWQLSGLCHTMGWNLEDVGAENLAKLKDRASRGKIEGNGDFR